MGSGGKFFLDDQGIVYWNCWVHCIYQRNPHHFVTAPPSQIFFAVNVSMGMNNGTFNRNNTDVVEKVTFLVAALQHWDTSVTEGSL